jgi:hypothetical protein
MPGRHGRWLLLLDGAGDDELLTCGGDGGSGSGRVGAGVTGCACCFPQPHGDGAQHPHDAGYGGYGGNGGTGG